ncbi:TRAP transporter substrate-binding protein DctP [Pseudonocardia ailaonensis]
MASMKPITIPYSTIQTADSPQGAAFRAFAEEVSTRTGGKVTFQPFFSGSLAPGDATLSGLKSGVVGAALLVPSYYPQQLPVSNALLNLGSLPHSTYPHGMIASSAAVMQFQTRNEALKQELGSNNVRILIAYQSEVGFNLLCTKSVDSLQDARGLRVRVGGGAWVRELEAMGMVPVQLPALETYEGLQRGVVDCVTATTSSMISFGYWDVAKHYIPVSMSPSNNSTQVINTEVWESLPRDAQAIVTEAAHTWWKTERVGALATYAKFATEGPSRHGVVFHDPAPFDEVLRKHQAGVVSTVSASGPPKTDPAAFVDGYRSLIEEWSGTATKALGTPEPSKDAKAILESYTAAQQMNYAEWDAITKKELFDAGSAR